MEAPQVGVLSKPKSGWAKEAIRRAQVNFIFKKFESQNEFSFQASAFMWEEVEGWQNISSYGTSHVAKHWTLSRRLVSALRFGELAYITNDDTEG